MSEELSGVLVVNKPTGMTSHDVVGRIRRLYHTRRVGHTGTLDPMAHGVLVILIGRAAKAAEYLTVKTKQYRAIMRLGLTTDTEDVTGKTLTVSRDIPSSACVCAAANGFVGDILQTPPMFSALKINGQKLCDLARRGIEVERRARPVTVYELHCEQQKENDYTLDVTCSAGTYIRTLCADIGARLGCGGVMASLCRTAVSTYTLDNAYTLEALEQMEEPARAACLLPVESLFAELPAVCLSPFFERLSRGGCEIYQKKIGTAYEIGTRVRMCKENGHFYALGEVREYENGSAIKSIKMFDIE